MRELAANELRRIALFAEVSDGCLSALLDSVRFQYFAPRTRLFEEGQRPIFLQILLEGEVELFAQFNENETTISVVHSAGVLNLAATINDVPHLTSARTRQRSRLLNVSAEAVRNSFDHDGIFARAITRELSHGFCELMLDLKNQKLLSCTERLADWLLRSNAEAGGSGQFMLPFRKRLLASQLGMTAENLSRSLKFLSGHGAHISGRSVNLVDPDALAAIAFATSEPGRRPRISRHPT